MVLFITGFNIHFAALYYVYNKSINDAGLRTVVKTYLYSANRNRRYAAALRCEFEVVRPSATIQWCHGVFL